MTARVIDFDRFRAEQKDEPVLFLIGGEEYALPSSLPASMAVDMLRMQDVFNDPEADVPPDVMDQFGRSLFGETMWEALLRRHRITVDEISPLMEQVFEAYTDAPKEETEESTSETQEPDSASSSTGRGSKPTSSASTRSTSKKS